MSRSRVWCPWVPLPRIVSRVTTLSGFCSARRMPFGLGCMVSRRRRLTSPPMSPKPRARLTTSSMRRTRSASSTASNATVGSPKSTFRWLDGFLEDAIHPQSACAACRRCRSTPRSEAAARASAELERDLVGVAPRPILTGLGRTDDRMRRLPEVRGCVLAGRVVTAADVRRSRTCADAATSHRSTGTPRSLQPPPGERSPGSRRDAHSSRRRYGERAQSNRAPAQQRGARRRLCPGEAARRGRDPAPSG